MESLTELLKNKILDSTESQENLKQQLEASEKKGVIRLLCVNF